MENDASNFDVNFLQTDLHINLQLYPTVLNTPDPNSDPDAVASKFFSHHHQFSIDTIYIVVYNKSVSKGGHNYDNIKYLQTNRN